MKYVKKIDLFQKFLAEYEYKNEKGGYFFIMSILFAIFFFMLKYEYWINSKYESRFILYSDNIPLKKDKTIDVKKISKIAINIDIHFFNISCFNLFLKVKDNFKLATDRFESNIMLQRFDINMNPIFSEISYTKETRNESKYEFCHTPREKYCANCISVIDLYIKNRKIYQNNNKTRICDNHYPNYLNESCRFFGNINVNKQDGRFEFFPVNFVSDNHDSFNLSHRINHLSFGLPTNDNNSLTNHTEIQLNTDIWKMFYIINIFPLGEKGFMYSYGSSKYKVYLKKNVSKASKISFYYNISPIGTYEVSRNTFISIIMEIFAVYGGIFAISRFLDAILYKISTYNAPKLD